MVRDWVPLGLQSGRAGLWSRHNRPLTRPVVREDTLSPGERAGVGADRGPQRGPAPEAI